LGWNNSLLWNVNADDPAVTASTRAGGRLDGQCDLAAAQIAQQVGLTAPARRGGSSCWPGGALCPSGSGIDAKHLSTPWSKIARLLRISLISSSRKVKLAPTPLYFPRATKKPDTMLVENHLAQRQVGHHIPPE